MTLFLTKVWGWDVPVGPLQFSTRGWRENALRQLKPGDQVVLVGTTGAQTAQEMKGRVLGVMEPTSEPVMSLDFDVWRGRDAFVDGEYKWPYGLMNRRAWSVSERPRLSELIDRRFSMDAAQGIVPLTDEEAALVFALDWKEAPLLQPTAQAQERMARNQGTNRRTAPPPTTTRRGVMHMRRAPAYTYAMRVVGAEPRAFKIGWAFDFKQRANQFNHAAMPDLGGLEYKPFLSHLWDTARQAFNMEQALLERFAGHRHAANNEIIQDVDDDELERAWISSIAG